MTWIQRYRFRNFIMTSAWIVPAGWAVLAIILYKLVWKFDLWARWKLLGHTEEGARALVGSISSSMLTFIVFLLTMIFIAIQISVAQSDPSPSPGACSQGSWRRQGSRQGWPAVRGFSNTRLGGLCPAWRYRDPSVRCREHTGRASSEGDAGGPDQGRAIRPCSSASRTVDVARSID